MDERAARSLRQDRASLAIALNSAALDLSTQRVRLFAILSWTSLVNLCCSRDSAFQAAMEKEWAEPEGSDTSYSKLRSDAGEILYDLCLCRFMDSAITFFRDAVAIGLVLDPAPLRSHTKTITHKEVLGFASLDDLVASLAVRKSEELAHDDFGLVRYCAEELRMPVFASDTERLKVKTAIRTRNILVHNGGRIDAKYTKALDLDASLIDTKVTLGSEELTDWIELLEACCGRVQAHLSSLWRERFPEDPAAVAVSEQEGSSDGASVGMAVEDRPA